MKSGFLLNVVIGESPTVFKLFAGKDQTLLVRRDALFILDLALYVIDSIARLYLKSDCLASDLEEICQSKLGGQSR